MPGPFMLMYGLLGLVFYIVVAIAVWKIFAISKDVAELKRMLAAMRDRQGG